LPEGELILMAYCTTNITCWLQEIAPNSVGSAETELWADEAKITDYQSYPKDDAVMPVGGSGLRGSGEVDQVLRG